MGATNARDIFWGRHRSVRLSYHRVGDVEGTARELLCILDKAVLRAGNEVVDYFAGIVVPKFFPGEITGYLRSSKTSFRLSGACPATPDKCIYRVL